MNFEDYLKTLDIQCMANYHAPTRKQWQAIYAPFRFILDTLNWFRDYNRR
jgi:hypothetical protein